ncbi:hypothetical protein LC612_36310 [Nostoc sp. CHAB 5834]|nr:hypothetical protein [Nostoc sp. CHAB 5834]
MQHLKSYNYLPAECEQMQLVCDACGGLRLRITRVYSGALEESVQNFLESLGKLNRSYLTALEEKLVKVLESEIRD